MGMNIAVIAGGTSTERDVSLSSGKLICASLRRNGHNANMIDVFLGSDKYDNVQDFFNDKNDLEELASELGKMITKIKEKKNLKASSDLWFLMYVRLRILYI